jgi:tryptophanyl-tRNA synthetase
MSKPVILTGLRANAEFHIGNYLGGILPVIELQNRHAGEYQVNMFVPDLHSFTTPIDHSTLYQQTLDNLKVFVAAGLNINNQDTYIYRQSFIPAHSELTWILDCFTGTGELSRMTQFKEKGALRSSEEVLDEQLSILERAHENIKSANNQEDVLYEVLDKFTKQMRKHYNELVSSQTVTAGLFNYPVLMAADILLYDAKYIPVGEDQRQHLELTRDLAIRLNNKFGKLFAVPEEWNKQLEFANRDAGVRIRSLRNPDKKMSKSIEDPSGTIMLSDSPSEAAKKIMRAETDSKGEIHFDFVNQPGVSNLLQMLALLGGRPQAEVNREWEGKSSYGDLKKAVADATELFLADFQTKLAAVDEAELLTKLENDEKKMNVKANETLLRVQKAVGLRK